MQYLGCSKDVFPSVTNCREWTNDHFLVLHIRMGIQLYITNTEVKNHGTQSTKHLGSRSYIECHAKLVFCWIKSHIDSKSVDDIT